MRRALITIAAAALLGACATRQVDNRTPEQIKASAADRSIELECVLVNTPWGPQRTNSGKVDKSAVHAGTAKCNPDGTLEITIEPKAPAPPKGP